MSWVLILVPKLDAKPPAVIGGYEDRSEAEAAGELATVMSVDYTVPTPDFWSFMVIPGAACCGPLGSTHGKVSYEMDWKDGPKRIIQRWLTRFP